MVIVHLISSAQLGGTEASLAEIAASFRQAQPAWHLRVICPEHGPLVQRLAEGGIAVDVEPFPQRLLELGEVGTLTAAFGGVRAVARLIGSLPAALRYRRALMARLQPSGTPPDVVHTHGFKMHVLGALSCPRPAMLVWHLHDYLAARRLSARILKRLVHRCHLVVANSTSVAGDARRILGDEVAIATVYNAVDLARFHPRGSVLDLDALAGLAAVDPGVVRVGIPAVFGRWKGHRVFLRAIAALGDLPVRAYVIGGPVYRTPDSQETLESLRAYAAELGVATRVAFTGPVSDPAPAIRALDVVVHASTDPEPFGMVIAEAMACGRAVIASGAGGAAEIVRDGIDGLHHRPGDDVHLAACIRTLVLNRPLRAELGRAARLSAEARFDRARLAAELAPLYAAPALA